MRPCTCDKSKKDDPWDGTGCRLCWLFHNDSDYRNHWRECGPARKIILESWLMPGDLVVLTATLEAFAKHWPEFQFKIRSNHDDIFYNNPHVYNFADSEAEQTIRLDIPKSMHNQWRDARYLDGFTEDIADKLDVKVKSVTTSPRLYPSQEELSAPRMIAGEYVVINSGYKKDGESKNWGFDNWFAVTGWIRSKGLAVVQVGGANDTHQLLTGAIDLRGKTSIRELFMLTYHATFGCGHESFLHHVAAAFDTPFICIASGIYPRTWAEYNTETYLSRQGGMDCCRSRGCGKWCISSCVHQEQLGSEIVPACMTRIKPAEVIAAIEQWYAPHGILNKDSRGKCATCR